MCVLFLRDFFFHVSLGVSGTTVTFSCFLLLPPASYFLRSVTTSTAAVVSLVGAFYPVNETNGTFQSYSALDHPFEWTEKAATMAQLPLRSLFHIRSVWSLSLFTLPPILFVMESCQTLTK